MISSLCFGWCGFFCREKRSIVAVKLVIVFLSNVKRLEKKWMHIRKMEKKKHKMINQITMTKKRKQGICWMIHHRRRKWSLSLTKLIEAVCHLQTKRSYQFLVLRYRETLTFQQVVSCRICANVDRLNESTVDYARTVSVKRSCYLHQKETDSTDAWGIIKWKIARQFSVLKEPFLGM